MAEAVTETTRRDFLYLATAGLPGWGLLPPWFR
jgi:hypothetical protein